MAAAVNVIVAAQLTSPVGPAIDDVQVQEAVAVNRLV